MRRRRWRVLATALVLALAACDAGGGSSPGPLATPPGGDVRPPAGGRIGVLLAAGDIACAPGEPTTAVSCHHDATARLLGNEDLVGPDLIGVVLLGDTQYERGLDREYASFDVSWGAAIEAAEVPVLPATGNHEYTNDDPAPEGCRLRDDGQHACGFERYFGEAPFTGTASDGHGSFARIFGSATPHPLVVIVLDVGRCGRDETACAPGGPVAGSLAEMLRDPLVNPPAACTVVAWHQARWSDYGHGDLAYTDAVWRALFVHGAHRPDLVLNGHDHLYARMPALDANGRPDDEGIVQVIDGAGGKAVLGLPFAGDPPGRTAFADVGRFGVVRVTWEAALGRLGTAFLTEEAQVVDERRIGCH